MNKRLMKRVLSLIAIVAMVVCGLSLPTTKEVVKASQVTSSGYRNVGYFASWAGYQRGYSLRDLDYTKITHLNFAFANLRPDGTVVVGDPWIDTQKTTENFASEGFTWQDQQAGRAGHFGVLRKIKKEHPQLKAVISIGGWTWSGNFSGVAADPAKRQKFANSCVDFVVKYGFDGVDIDWEYPVEGGNNIPHRPDDKQNYTLLLKAVREALNAQGAKDGKTYLLTIASSANHNFVNNIDVTEIMKYLDFINVMTYDYHGGFDPETNFNTPLFLSPYDTTGTTFSIDRTTQAYLDAGAQLKDLNLGLAYYGRGWINVNATAKDCLFHPGSAAPQKSKGIDVGTWEGGNWDYWDIKENYIGKRGYVRYWDDYAKAPYLFSEEKKVFITYDDAESINIKIDYLMSKGYGGAMFWEASSDKRSELLDVTANRLGVNGGVVIPPTQIPTPPVPTPTPEPTPTGGPTPEPTPTVPVDAEAWDASKEYPTGSRVSYQGQVFEAKWWTEGEAPDASIDWNPWRLVSGANVASVISSQGIGSSSMGVLATARNSFKAAAVEAWDANKEYKKGSRVSYQGQVYEAKWWTSGDTPDASIDWNPWRLVSGEPTPTITPIPTPDPTPEPTPDPTPEPTPNPVDRSGLPKHMLTGYWQNFNNGAKCLKISEVPSTYNLIAVAFADATSTPGEVTFNLDSVLSSKLGGYTKQEFIQDIAAAKQKGQKVIISVGGEVGNVLVTNEVQATNFANSVYQLMQEYGFDGVDIDLEHGIRSQYLTSALRQLRSKAGDTLIITLAPQTIDMQNVNMEYFKLAIAIKDILTVVNTQFYNSGTMLGQDQKVYAQGNVDFITALAAIQLENGLRPDQVGLGLPASTRGAGSGHVEPAVVSQALNCLANGSGGGSYVPVRAYPSLRGAMTWSINWDASNNYQFANEVSSTLKTMP